MNVQNLITELKRRNVFRVATAYAIAGWLIIQVFATIAPQLGFPDWIAPLVTTLVLIGFPLALIFAWAFELTPEGIKKSDEVELEESVSADTGKKINKIIIGSLSVLVFFLLTERIFFAESTILDRDQIEYSQASIAVLPFADLSPEGDQEYFSDGLSEELLNVLAKVEDMKVAGRTSSFKFKGQNENLTLIGSELGVDHILEGSVRKAGNRLRITAQLIKVEDGFHMWSETYDREYNTESIFDIQDEISQMVLNELKVRLLDNDPDELIALSSEIPTTDIEAYEAYLRGIQLLRNRNPDEIRQAILEFERAIDLDQSYAEAYARLAIAYARLYEYGSINIEEAKELIRLNADQALFLDNSSGEAYAGLGEYYELEFDDEKRKDALKKAYELNPNNPEILIWYSQSLFNGPEERLLSRELVKEAYEIDPLSPVIIQNLALDYQVDGEYEKALDLFDRNIELNPDYTRAKTAKINLIAGEGFGKLDEAVIEHHKFLLEHPNTIYNLSSIVQYATNLGLSEIADHYLEVAKSLYPENMSILMMELNREIFKGNRDYFKEFVEIFNMDEEELAEVDLFIELTTLINTEQYSEAIELIKSEEPKFFSDTLTIVDDISQFANLRLLFDEVGDTTRADMLASLNCESSSTPLEFEGEISKEESRALINNLNCFLLARDYERYFMIVEELYFTRKYKSSWFGVYANFSSDKLYYNAITEFDDPNNVLVRIEEDKARMRANVVAYFKEIGEWQESWELTD